MRPALSDPRVRRLRETFVGNGVVGSGLAAEIALSWRRSRLAGVEPTSTAMTYQPVSEGAHRLLLRAAAPVLDRLSEQVTDGMAVILADGEARVLERRTGNPSLSRRLDRLSCAPGFSFAEQQVGTNALGAAAESASPVLVRGAEHYREVLSDMAAVATVVRHPIHRRIVGTFAVTCCAHDVNGLMMPLQMAAVREIERRMYDAVSGAERAILEAFLLTSRRSPDAVIALSQEFVIANTAASRMLAPADEALLWEWASALPADGRAVAEMRLADGTLVRGRGRAVGGGVRPLGVVLELRDATTRGRRAALRGDTEPDPSGGPVAPAGTAVRPVTHVAHRPDQALPGRSPGWQRVLADLAGGVASDGDVLVLGERGVGKTWLAQLVAGASYASVDGALSGIEPGWLELVRDLLGGTRVVVLRHLDQVDPRVGDALASLLAAPRAVRVVATSRTSADVRLADHFASRIEIPPLRSRTEDIVDLAPVLLREGGDTRLLRLQPPALRALMDWRWDGNVRELVSVLTAARAAAMGTEIALAHLPSEYRHASPVRNANGLERVERDALLAALADSGGNKVDAAARLGIARSTLYRKMRSFGLDPKRPR